jgi:hypothetical protein
MNVSDFTGVISSKGLASSNKFEVDITFPDGLSIKDLNLMCDSATIAGKTIQSTPEINYGVRREVAYNAPTLSDLTLSFYCTEKLEEKKKLDQWQNLMVNTINNNTKDEVGTYDVGYYDSYAKNTKITVTKLSVSGKPTYKYEYRNVFPKIIGAIDLSHGVSSGPLKVTAQFAYAYSLEKKI